VKCRRSNRCASIGRDHKSESLHHTGFTVNGCSHLFTCRTDSTLIFLAPHGLQACDTLLRADIMKLCFSDASDMARRIWSWYQRKPNGSKGGGWGSLGKRVHTADRESHSRKCDRSVPSRLGRLPREKIAVLSAKDTTSGVQRLFDNTSICESEIQGIPKFYILPTCYSGYRTSRGEFGDHGNTSFGVEDITLLSQWFCSFISPFISPDTDATRDLVNSSFPKSSKEREKEGALYIRRRSRS
jgi:hypothetical protein